MLDAGFNFGKIRRPPVVIKGIDVRGRVVGNVGNISGKNIASYSDIGRVNDVNATNGKGVVANGVVTDDNAVDAIQINSIAVAGNKAIFDDSAICPWVKGNAYISIYNGVDFSADIGTRKS